MSSFFIGICWHVLSIEYPVFFYLICIPVTTLGEHYYQLVLLSHDYSRRREIKYVIYIQHIYKKNIIFLKIFIYYVVIIIRAT